VREQHSDVEMLVAAALRGTPPAVALAASAAAQSEFLQFTRRHCLQPILYAGLRHRPDWEHWPPPVREELAREARRQAAVDACREAAVREALAALVAHGVAPLVIKGTALAYSHYPQPACRPRDDTDLLLRASDRATAAAALAGLGYAPMNSVSGELVSYQQIFIRGGPGPLSHVLDVHWRVLNPQRFAGLFSYDEIAAAAVPLPALSPAARAPTAVHALLLACVHRLAHHQDGDRLLWLYDIHLLASGLSPAEHDELVRLAAEKGVARLCVAGLSAAARWFGPTLPEARLHALAEPAAQEPSEDFLRDGARRWHLLRSDLAALDSWRMRVRLLREHLFPPAAYMLRRYGVSRRWVLPLLYVRRGLSGAAKLLRPMATPPP
jgi:hypothetical protein